jgi:putative nucleotidyltransferase with HDIG domain
MLLTSIAINVPLALAAAGLIQELDLGGTAFAAFTLIAFSYMARLVSTARHRSKQYASLSWGVLSGLLRTLSIRDPRAARHAAAVAAFARDIAREAGMSDEEQELAHTAGLLHDIGNFALSDRVFERGRVLTDEDWDAIRQHPVLGADMLRDLGLYGPVRDRPRAPRTGRRARLPGSPEGRRDPRAGEDHRGGRGLRHADGGRHVPHGGQLVPGTDGAAARRRLPARRRLRRGALESACRQ